MQSITLSRLLSQLSAILHMRTDELERRLRLDRNFVWLARKLDPEQGRQLDRLSLEGIGTVMEGATVLSPEDRSAHVLGFAGIDGEGLEGVEHRYESYLRGEKRDDGAAARCLGAHRLFPKGMTERSPTPGQSLTLTIDEVIQYIAERELEDAVGRAQAKSGTMIVLDPKTGAVLAMAVSPRLIRMRVGLVPIAGETGRLWMPMSQGPP